MEDNAFMKPPLKIVVLWHSEYDEGEQYAKNIFNTFNHDINAPFSQGIGIPVYFRFKKKNGEITAINLDDTEKTAIVLIIDNNLVLDTDWSSYIEELFETIENAPDNNSIIYPVAINTNSFKICDGKFAERNFLRLYEREEFQQKNDLLLFSLSHELCRLIYNKERVSEVYDDFSPAPIKIFISHSKRDKSRSGIILAEKIRNYIYSDTPLKAFFDANDIASGFKFPDEIGANIEQSVLLIIHSDTYSEREWCRKEVIKAKNSDCPIFILKAMDEGENRSFPYMANVPCLKIKKWDSIDLKDIKNEEIEKVLFKTLLETLKFKFQKEYIRYNVHLFNQNLDEIEVLSYPPELYSLLQRQFDNIKYIVYPDPPLGNEEIDIINQFLEKIQSKPEIITTTFLSII